MGRHFEVRAAAMAKTANAKAKVYSRYSKEILVAAKNGDPDPDMNQTLKKQLNEQKQITFRLTLLNVLLKKQKVQLMKAIQVLVMKGSDKAQVQRSSLTV